MSEIHEFMLLRFETGVAVEEQRQTMWELDRHLGGCEGLVRREYFHGEAEGTWVEHVVWADEAAAAASEALDEDPAAALLFGRFDPVGFARGRQVAADGCAGASPA